MFRVLIIASVLAIGISACGKNRSGGRAQINVHVIYDNKNVGYNIVRLKYGANGLPADGSYDETDTCDHTGKTQFEKLRKGDYYVYLEYAPDTSNETFVGGAHVKIENGKGEQHVVIDLAEENPL